jgi:hypothetical protein
MSDRRTKLKRLGAKVLSGAKMVGSTVLKYGVPVVLAYSVGAHDGTLQGHRRGFDIGREHGKKEGYDMGKEELLTYGDARYREGAEDLAKDWTPKLREGLQHIRRTYDDKESEWQRDRAARKIQYAFAKHKNNKLVKAYDTSQGLVQALSTHAMQQEEKYKNLEEQYGDLHAMNLALRDAAASAPGPQRLHHKFRNALPF